MTLRALQSRVLKVGTIATYVHLRYAWTVAGCVTSYRRSELAASIVNVVRGRTRIILEIQCIFARLLCIAIGRSFEGVHCCGVVQRMVFFHGWIS